MTLSRMLSVIALASGILASPIAKRQSDTSSTAITDTVILNLALTLEHLESAFYGGALSKFDESAFAAAGYAPWVRQRFEQIYSHEQAHVTFLESALGANASKPCTYDFPYTDPKSFAALSMILEGVGVSAYLGAAQSIENKDYLTAAGSILTTESRHAAWVASAVEEGSAFPSAFDVPLDFMEIYSLASDFITACPSTNVRPPFHGFPSLTAELTGTPSGQTTNANSTVTLAYNGTASGVYLALFTGLDTTYAVNITDFKATLPMNLTGTVYGVIATHEPPITDDSIIAGVAVFEFGG